MNKFYQKLGYRLLKMSGLDIPEDAYKHTLIPVELPVEFKCSREDAGKFATSMIRDAENRVLDKVRPYIHRAHKAHEDYFDVKVSVMVMRRDRKGE